MAAPVIHSRNDFQVANDGDNSYVFSLTNAPQAGGIVVVLASVYPGTGAVAVDLAATGGSGITITNRADTIGAVADQTGVLIWTVEYSSAPTSLEIKKASGAGMYASGSALNITGQAASYFDVSGASTGTSTSPTATAMGDLTDSTDLVLGVMSRDATSGTISAGTNWTEVVEIDETNTTYQACNIVQRTPGATGAYDPTWALSASDGWYAAGIAIKGTSSGTSITTGLGQLTLTGLAPTLAATDHKFVTPGLGALTITGYAPSIGASFSISPGLGALSLTGYAPSVSATGNASITAGLGALTLSGYAPSLTLTVPTPPAASLVLTGYAPTVSSGGSISITTGLASLSLTGYSPDQTLTLYSPDPAALVLTGYAPSVAVGANYSITPGLGSLVLTGAAPTVSATAHVFVTTGLGELTLTGLAPTAAATANQFASPGIGTLTLTGYSPSLTQAGSFSVTTGLGELTLVGYAPEVENSGDSRPMVGGRPSKRRRYTVVVDGEEFAVDSPAEAEAVLKEARQVAEQKAQEVLQRAAKAEKRPIRKVLADARKALPVPKITTDAPISGLNEILSEIESLYRSTLQTVEIGALLRRQEDEEDDEAILLLIA